MYQLLEEMWRKRYYYVVEKFRHEGIETTANLNAVLLCMFIYVVNGIQL
jgi:hypothetical protein